MLEIKRMCGASVRVFWGLYMLISFVPSCFTQGESIVTCGPYAIVCLSSWHHFVEVNPELRDSGPQPPGVFCQLALTVANMSALACVAFSAFYLSQGILPFS